MDKKCYELARKEPGSRQEFLEEIDLGVYSAFIKEIVYFKGVKGDRIMVTVSDTESHLRLNTLSTIKVSDYSFSTYSWYEFCNILIHHEGLHASQNYYESTSPDGKILELKFKDGNHLVVSERAVRQEYAAHKNQILHSTFLECSDKFKEYVGYWLGFYERLRQIPIA